MKIINIYISSIFLGASWIMEGSNIMNNLSDIAQSLQSFQRLKPWDPINPQVYIKKSDELMQTVEKLNKELTECYVEANNSYTKSLYVTFLKALQDHSTSLSESLHQFSQILNEFFTLLKDETELKDETKLKNEATILFPTFLTSFAQINKGLDSFLPIYKKIESKIYTNFNDVIHLDQLIHDLTLWSSRLQHIQSVDITLQNHENARILNTLESEIINAQSKIETLKREIKDLEQEQSLKIIQSLLTESLTKTIKTPTNTYQIFLRDLIAKTQLTHDGLPATTEEGMLIFDHDSLIYEIDNISYNIQKLLQNYGLNI